MSENELAGKVRELKELEALISQAEKEIETIHDTIKKVMTEKNTESMNVDVYKVRWQTVAGSRFDTAAFKQEAPELYSRYSKPTVTRRFSVA